MWNNKEGNKNSFIQTYSLTEKIQKWLFEESIR